MKKRERNGVSKEYLFCLSDVSLQRYETSKFEKNAFFTKSAAVHNFYIANSPWNLYLNSKSHKIWKKRERNGVSKKYFILSVGRFVAKIWTTKFEKNVFFTKSAALHNFFIANSLWNIDLNSKSHKIWKNEKGMAFLRNILFCLWNVSLQRYDSANRRPILEKTLFHTVGSCTLWPKQLTCLADGGGCREDQHMWDGQGLKDPCFFLNFF